VELCEDEPEPYPWTSAPGSRGEKGPDAKQRQECQRVQYIERDDVSPVVADESQRGRNRAQNAVPVFHDDPYFRIVDDKARGDEHTAEDGVEQGTHEEGAAFHAHVACQGRELFVEQPWMNVREQPPIDQAGD